MCIRNRLDALWGGIYHRSSKSYQLGEDTMRAEKYLAVTVLVGVLSSSVRAEDWPQFQGPDRNGISTETGLLKAWPKSGPEVKWEVSVGMGYSAPSICGGEVFILDRTAEDDPEERKDVLRCFDLKTGSEKWKSAYAAPGKMSHDGSRCPPTVDEKRVYTVGPFGHFYCFDRETKAPVWNVNLLEELEGRKANWGVGQSPVLYGDWVVVAVQGEETGIAAFDRKTGKMAWKSKGLGKAGYVSPVLVTLDGVDQFIMTTAKAESGKSRNRKRKKDDRPAQTVAETPNVPFGTYGISAADGTVLWSYTGWACKIPIPNATYVGDGKLLITGGYGSGSAMIQVKGSEVTELFKLEDIGSQIQQPLLIGDHLYFDNNENSRRDGMGCMTLGGQLKWTTKEIEGAPKYDRGNLMVADGMIYAIDAEGNLRMIRPDPEKYDEVASASLLTGKEIWAPIALSDGLMVIRDQSVMKCINIREP